MCGLRGEVCALVVVKYLFLCFVWFDQMFCLGVESGLVLLLKYIFVHM